MTQKTFQPGSFFASATSAAWTSIQGASMVAAMGSVIGNGSHAAYRYINHASVYNSSGSVDTVVRMFLGSRLVKTFAAPAKGGEAFDPSIPVPVASNEAIVFRPESAASLEFSVNGFTSGN